MYQNARLALVIMCCALTTLFATYSNASAQACSSDADCDQDYQCVKDTVEPGCLPGDGGCDASAEAADAGAGECMVKRLECKTDDDCPEGLTCDIHQTRSCTMNADGGEECETTQNSTGNCEYTSTPCVSDSDCKSKYECATLSEGKICSTGMSIEGDASSTADASCKPAEKKECFPKRVDCANDSDCETGWKCFTFSESTAEPPVSWKATGEVKSCLPEVLAAMAEGVAGGGSAKGTSGGGAAGSVDLVGATDAGSKQAEKSSDSGCTVVSARTGTGKDARFIMALAAIALLLGYRRRRKG